MAAGRARVALWREPVPHLAPLALAQAVEGRRHRTHRLELRHLELALAVALERHGVALGAMAARRRHPHARRVLGVLEEVLRNAS